ncbi:MAG: Rha family transcriptional regulator [Peptoanaerobacter stomatis]|uniref:Rha family transcriptional regulator n=1 Tax=Peptoanaerobacter stomatis TaxID=796937 RepID=UPI003F9FF5E5
MNNLDIFENKYITTLDSRQVSTMLGKEHSKLLRDIETYTLYLTEAKIGLSDFFLKSQYTDSTGRTLPCYQITKKGCEFLAHKLTGQKGTIFTAKYINAFEKLQDTTNQNTNSIQDKQIIQMLVQTQNNMLSMIQALNTKIDNINQDTKMLKKPNKTKRKLLVQTLPKSIIKIIDTMLLSEEYNYKEISKYLQSMGYTIGKYAISRYNKQILKGEH